jgi:transcriptional antiterminator NusG
MFTRHHRNWGSWLSHQTDIFCVDWRWRTTHGLIVMGEEKRISSAVFAVRTTAGQEKNVANLIEARVRMDELPIRAVLVPEMLKGYVFIEADGPHSVEKAIAGIRHVRSRVPGVVTFPEVERYIIAKPVIEELDEEDLVEIVGGPFKGMRAKITRVDKPKEEVTLELLEATFTLPITVHADYVKLVEKGRKEG